MSDSLASFSELKGIGPATEARLHETGIYTWAALAAAAQALAAVRGEGDSLRELAEAIAERRADEGVAAEGLPGNGERLESFVLRLTLAPDHEVRRAEVTHVRSMSSQTLAGWTPEGLVSFIEAHSGLRPGPAPVAARDVGGTTRRAVPSRTAPSATHMLFLDAGKVIGGFGRDVNLVVTGTTSVRGDFTYRATLAARRLGSEQDASGWVAVASQRGGGTHARDVPLGFESVLLPSGVHRLQLQLEVRLDAPVNRPPAFVLA